MLRRAAKPPLTELLAWSKKLGLSVNEADVLKIARKGKELGMTYNDLATALRIPVGRLHNFMLRRGTPQEAQEIVGELRRGPDF
jgi:hypothetical protein